MKLKTKSQAFTSLVLFLFLLNPSCSKLETMHNDSCFSAVSENIHFGVILDMGSLKGKIGHTCISMAISDFYAINSHYQTRLVVHTRDSKGDPFRALSTAIKLMDNINLQAILIGGEMPMEAKLLAEFGVRAEVPIISVLPTAQSPSLAKYPNLVQFTRDETSQVKGITSLIKAFRWRNVILVYEETNYGQELISSMTGSFQDADIRIARNIAIKTASSTEHITKQLHMAAALQISVFVVHMSPYLASLLFLNVKKLGMMGDGYIWIVTDKTMNLLHLMDSSQLESMQGVLGFKPYIPPSQELKSFSLRWKRKFFTENLNIEEIELNTYGTWAYDAVWALAMAAERARTGICESKYQATKLNMTELITSQTSQSGSIILKEMLLSRFKSLSGEIHLHNGKIISRGYVVGKEGRRIAFWTPATGIAKAIDPSDNKMFLSSPNKLETTIWEGGSTALAKRRLHQTRNKILKVGVPPNGFKELVNIACDPKTNATIATGYCIDVFKSTIEALPYEVAYEFIPFMDSDGKLAGTYNDLIDQVFYENYDAVVGDVTITANRSLCVDFTLPFTDLGSAMVVKTTQGNNMWIFLKPLTPGLWLTSAAFFILTGFVIWIIEHPINNEFQGSASQQIGTTLWFAFSTLVFAHKEKLSSNLSKMVVIVWVFVVLILTSSYTATLAGMLTVQQIESLSKETYIGSQAGYMLDQVASSNLNFANTRLRPYGAPEEYAEALSRGSQNGGVSAIVGEIPYLKVFLAKYPNQYSMINPRPDTNGFAFVFRKGSPLIADISREIARLREEGKLRIMEDAWFKNQGSSMTDGSTNNGPKALGLKSFGGLFVISAFTTSLAIFIFLIIFLVEKWHHVRSNVRNLFLGHSESISFLAGKVLDSISEASHGIQFV